MSFERIRAGLGAAILTALVAAPAAVRAELPDPIRFGVAIESGDLHRAAAWLDQGLDPDFVANRIGTGLMIAAWEGNIPMMELFVSRGADINRANRLQEQALMHAAWKGRLEAVRWLLDRGARIDRDGRKWSALHYAVFAGHRDVVQLLLERGADINARSTNGSSALMMAAREGHEDLAKLLLERGADAAVANEWDDDAVAWAMRHGHPRIARAIASPGRFAEVARQPPDSFGPTLRSVPVTPVAEALLSEMRLEEDLGHLDPDRKEAYLAKIAELQRQAEEAAAAARQEPPRALEIRARRGEPDQEEAQLIYDREYAEPVRSESPVPAAAKTRAAGKEKPGAKQGKPKTGSGKPAARTSRKAAP